MCLNLRFSNNFLDGFGKDCLLNTTDVDENDKIHVEYNGKTVDFGCHYFKFRRRKYGFLDEHSLCVTPLYFNDSDCAVDIDIKTSLSGVTQHVCVYIFHTMEFYF